MDVYRLRLPLIPVCTGQFIGPQQIAGRSKMLERLMATDPWADSNWSLRRSWSAGQPCVFQRDPTSSQRDRAASGIHRLCRTS